VTVPAVDAIVCDVMLVAKSHRLIDGLANLCNPG
jgi:hypothetical protein